MSLGKFGVGRTTIISHYLTVLSKWQDVLRVRQKALVVMNLVAFPFRLFDQGFQIRRPTFRGNAPHQHADISNAAAVLTRYKWRKVDDGGGRLDVVGIKRTAQDLKLRLNTDDGPSMANSRHRIIAWKKAPKQGEELRFLRRLSIGVNEPGVYGLLDEDHSLEIRVCFRIQ